MRVVLAVVAMLIAVGPLRAQEPEGIASDTSSVSARHLRTVLLLSGAYWVGGMAVMERVWYRDRERVPFHFFNDNAAYLQVDKAGHAFGAYVQSYVGYHWLRHAGLSRSSALLYGGGLGVILQTPIEVMDGIHEGWGFSWGDMAANVAGSALVVGQDLLLSEQLIKFKFSYWGSEYAAMANGYLGTTTLERLLEDYNGHNYWLSIPLGRLTPGDGVPRWLNVAVGYGANGMIGEFENRSEFDGMAIPEVDRYRQFLVSLDVDWAQIETNTPLLKALFNGLTFVKLPFPALELSSRHGVRAYWMYY